MKEVVYTAESRLRRPGAFIADVLRDMASRRTWELSWALAHRDIAASYRQTLLGYVWGILPTIAFAFVLTLAARNKVIQFGATSIPYPAYVMIGFVLWQTFVEALMGPVNALSQAKSLLARIDLPKEALVIAKIWEVFFNQIPKLLVVAGVILWYQLPVSWNTLFVPFGLLALILLGTSLGLLVAPIGLLYDDIRRMLPLFVQFGLIVTPVVYPLPQAGIFAAIVSSNPVTPLLMTTRDWLTGEAATLTIPFLGVVFGAIVLLLLGMLGLRLVSPFAIERLSS